MGDVFADRPIELIGKWTGRAEGRITVKGRTGGAPYEASFDVAAEAAKGSQNPALRPLWAREKVRALGDDIAAGRDPRTDAVSAPPADLVSEITTLGLNYGLLTEYTSFVGVDETPREMLAQANAVTQPLPLPQGVSNSAVGAGQTVVVGVTPVQIGAAPEPGVAGLLILSFLSLLLQRRRKW